MQLPYRLEQALEKIYTAFYHDELNPEDCWHCAVGNICDNVDAWKHFTDIHGSVKLNYLGRLHETLGKRINGYSPIELLSIEASFLKGCGYSLTARNQITQTCSGHKQRNDVQRSLRLYRLPVPIGWRRKCNGIV